LGNFLTIYYFDVAISFGWLYFLLFIIVSGLSLAVYSFEGAILG
jgi:hypothetical protein